MDSGALTPRRASDLAMTRRVIDAERARRWGMVTDVTEDPVSAAVALAEQIAARSQVAVQTILKQCHRGADADYIMTRYTGKVR